MRVTRPEKAPMMVATVLFYFFLFYFTFRRMKVTLRNWNNEMKLREKVRVITCWVFGYR